MFCFQCQETAKNQGCTIQGVCGKTDETAKLLDLLVYTAKGIAVWGEKARALGLHDDEVDLFVAEALFSTITNVNFDPDRIERLVHRGITLRDRVRDLFLKGYQEKNGQTFAGPLPAAATFQPLGDRVAWLAQAEGIGVKATADEDVRSLRELLTYGTKGIAAYADHAYVLGHANPAVLAFLQKALAATTDDRLGADELLPLVLEAGKTAVDVMALLDQANTGTYGNPEITQVFTGTVPGPGILVSGHDLLDFAELLKQTEGTGVNVYTHGEMLPANAYPAFKKYKHLVGNFGTSWYNQQKEFEEFGGAIVMTTNCIQKPRDSYKDRIFTTGLVAFPGLPHIAARPKGGSKDFSAVIAKAKSLGSVMPKEGKRIPIGFTHATVLGLADKVVAAIKAGAIRRFVVMAGCDGRHKEREYFTEFAKALPKDTVILTAGCAKYRYNMLDLGDIGGIPRVLDAGQCNDSYSLAVIALKLKEVFGVAELGDLPISFNIGWYEQKAVAVLLALLYLGVKNIHLGPTVPAFLSPNVVKVLVDKFQIHPDTTVAADLPQVMAGH
ncbi:MAG TPA: hydroxylamine reductase [Candidatus Aminicenantes bacterium]|nr:hydroxylamine reductase [Candidatus Aminicenantes bacterium]